jgi:hypothetical protein
MDINMIEKETTLFPKVLIIFALVIGFKLFFSCTPESQDPMDLNYNKISVVGIDNSGQYLEYYSSTDTLYSDAVALKLTLTDTANRFASLFLPNLKQVFSFQTLQADDVDPVFIPVNKVVDINIKTLMDINDSIKAGADITEYFLYSIGGDFQLYQNLSQGLSSLNGIQSFHESSSIILILKTSIENTNAQFEVEVALDNGDKLKSTTVIFDIIKS